MKDEGLEHAMLHTYDICRFSAVKLTSEQNLKTKALLSYCSRLTIPRFMVKSFALIIV